MVLSFTGAAAGAEPSGGVAIVPQPVKLTSGGSEPFVIVPGKTAIVADPALAGVAKYLQDSLSPAMGALPVADQASGAAIVLTLDPSLSLGEEGYRLNSSEAELKVTGRSPAGVFYGVQTLRQLLPTQAFSDKPAAVKWTVPAVVVEDEPRFGWRGMHLDVSRHFFSKVEVKNFIDLLALHKFNTFHWHLVDDQGWRIEIKKYPKLTEVGAWRTGVGWDLDPKSATAWGPDGRYGGFYTQDDIREVVAYARSRFINVVPEIEMPGHSVAVLAAYPDLSCSGAAFSTDVKGGIHPGVLCASNPKVDQFITDVLDEVLALFPSKFIHVGGDEVPKEPWKECARCQAFIKERNLKDEHGLQSDFIRRADKYLTSKGRRLIGWDEILEGGLAEGATVMSWRGTEGGIAAAKAGHDVVMSPTSHCYFDHYQGDPKTQPRAWGGYTSLAKVYSFEPIPAGFSAEQARHILGGQANLWSEIFPNYRQVQWMAYPRGCALAEAVWSPRDRRDWADFKSRLAVHLARLQAMQVNYCPNAIDAPLEKPTIQPSN